MRCLLLGERVALNVLARCSGIATRSQQVLGSLRSAGYTGRLAGTRKTTPGFRLPEKYAMVVGGCDPHRYDLSHMVMLKDNHVNSLDSTADAVAGGLAHAVARAKAAAGFATKIEVECSSAESATAAYDAGADVIMLDNLTARDAARTIEALKSAKRSVIIEISGGITPDNAAQYADARADVISSSSIHQGVPHVDFSMKLASMPQPSPKEGAASQ